MPIRAADHGVPLEGPIRERLVAPGGRSEMGLFPASRPRLS
jgi:hypothetical protein